MGKKLLVQFILVFAVFLLLQWGYVIIKQSRTPTLILLEWQAEIPKNLLNDFYRQTGVEVKSLEMKSYNDLKRYLKSNNSWFSTKPRANVLFMRDDYALDLINSELISELNIQNIPNYYFLPKNTFGRYYDPHATKIIPYSQGLFGIIVSATAEELLTDWETVFSNQPPARGIGSQLETNIISRLISRSLGNTDFCSNTTYELPIGKVIDRNNWSYYPSAQIGDFFLLNNSVVLTTSQVALNITKISPKFKFLLNSRGQNYGYYNVIAVPKGGNKDPISERFIDYLLDPNVSLLYSNLTQLVTSVKVPEKKITQHLKGSDVYKVIHDSSGTYTKFCRPGEAANYQKYWEDKNLIFE